MVEELLKDINVHKAMGLDGLHPKFLIRCSKEYPYHLHSLNIQPVVVVRGLKRQQDAALTNFVGCFFSLLSYFFFLFLGAE